MSILGKKLETFTFKYKVSPLLSIDIPEITVGFEQEGRWGKVRGRQTYTLLNSEWFEDIQLPRVPKKLADVFG